MVANSDSRHMGIIAPGVFDHENLESERTLLCEPGNFFRNGPRRIVIKVDDGFLLVIFDKTSIAIHGRGRRIHVRHADRKGHAAGRGRHGSGGQILFVCEAWVSVMGVRVNQAGNDFLTLGVDDAVG